MSRRCVPMPLFWVDFTDLFLKGNTDVAVPLSRLAEIVEISKEEAKSLGLKVCVKGHVGDSNFHENITYKKDDPEQASNAELAVKNMVMRALEMEGTCTGEHGIGLGKRDALATEVGPDTIIIMVSTNALACTVFPTTHVLPGHTVLPVSRRVRKLTLHSARNFSRQHSIRIGFCRSHSSPSVNERTC